jgi:diguanylate cyclase (GGDEF)-like protein
MLAFRHRALSRRATAQICSQRARPRRNSSRNCCALGGRMAFGGFNDEPLSRVTQISRLEPKQTMTNQEQTLDPARLLAIIRIQAEIAKLGLDLNDVVELVVQEARSITGAAGAVIELADGGEMVYRAVAGLARGQLGLRLNRKGSLSGRCIAEAQSLRCDDSETDPHVDREACRRVGLRSMIVVPLRYRDEAVGALKIISPQPSAFDERDTKTLELMSDLIAAAMFHAAKYGADELFLRATRDSLTGLANRAHFYDRMRHAIAQAQRNSERMGVLMLDMDGLKQINDVYGHRAGDAANREFAMRISQDARQSDTVARLGGDEFGIVLSTVEDRQSAQLAGRRVTERSEGALSFAGERLQLGASIGVAVYPEDGDQPDTLVESADKAMYVMKRERKCTHHHAVPGVIVQDSLASACAR